MAKQDTSMIVQHFAAPKKEEHKPVVYGVPWNNKHTPRLPQQQHPDIAFESERAKKAGLSIEEYRRRCSAVRNASNACSFQTGDTVFPVKEEDYLKYGQCQITSIVRHFDDYGDIEWNEAPLIVSLKSRKLPEETLVTSVGWIRKRQMQYENQVEC